ncbi:MAG: hypothetical protein IKN57_06000, partial [Parasporobacterium sp.]|nr:hypothetical protein [Parasporobacterium sp.]
RTYRLTDSYIKCGSGRSTAYFSFDRTRVMIVGNDYIELRAKFGGFLAYIPKEDMEFVKKYIRSRLPAIADVRYE